MRFRRKPKPIHPVHGYSLGCAGTERAPFTWFACSSCGYRTLESSCKEFSKTCEGRWGVLHDEVSMVVADPLVASAATASACDGRVDLIERARYRKP